MSKVSVPKLRCISARLSNSRISDIWPLSCVRWDTCWGCRRAAAQNNMLAPRLRAAPLFSFPCCAFYIASSWSELPCVDDFALVMDGILRACKVFRFLWSCDAQTREIDLHFLFFMRDSHKQCLQATFYENWVTLANDQIHFLSDTIVFHGLWWF